MRLPGCGERKKERKRKERKKERKKEREGLCGKE
jgi:hypothetical protein